MYIWKDSNIHIGPFVKEGPIEFLFNGKWEQGQVIQDNDITSYLITTDNGRRTILSGDYVLNTDKEKCPVKELTIEHSLLLNKYELPAIPDLNKHLTFSQGLLVGLFLMYGEYNRNKDNILGFTLEIPVNVYNKVKPNIKKIKPIQSALMQNCMVLYYNDSSLVEFLQTWVNEGVLNTNCIAQSIQFREGIIEASFDDKICSFKKEFLDIYEALLTSLGKNTDRKILPYTIYKLHKYGLYLTDKQWTKIKSIERVDNMYKYIIKDKSLTLANGIII